VAGSVVLNGQYEDFAAREDNNWFKKQLTDFEKEVNKVTEHSKGWPKDISKFLPKVIPPDPIPEGDRRKDSP
jgi:hypothetical protein